MRDLLFAIVLTPILVAAASAVLWWVSVKAEDRIQDRMEHHE